MTSPLKDIKHWGNRYTLLKKIGTGAFGTAYKVKDVNGPEGQGSIKVLKEISIDTMDKDEIDECAREGKLLSKLDNPYIVQYFDSFCFQGVYCIITEFCEGGDLHNVLISTKEKGCHLPEKKILRWFIEIVQGLDYIHKRKVLHRDLKPRNIFLKTDSAKIGDFGISRILNFTMDMASTFLGTPYYMSPEVLKHDGYDTTSDVWSVGVILYEMCSLIHAFEAHSIMTVMVKILEEPVPKIPEIYTDDIQNLIESILIKDPSKRPSAHDILDFQFIKDTIKDPWIDIAANMDLSETMVAKETRDISDFMSQPVKLKTLADNHPDETRTMLTPKEKLALKKRLKSEREAETQKQLIRESYQENQEIRYLLKEKSSIDSFAKSSCENRKTSISEYSGLNSFWNSGAQTQKPTGNVITERNEHLSHTENIRTHFKLNWKSHSRGDNKLDKPPHHEDMTIRPSGNHQELYNITYSNFKFDDPTKCNITTYDADSDDFHQEVEQTYLSDFDSDESLSDSEDSDDQLTKNFQNDNQTDPFGKSIKSKKIYTMEKKCLEKIDEITLNNAFVYLEEYYYTDDYLSGLRRICKSDDVAATVDQLFFLKNPKKEVF